MHSYTHIDMFAAKLITIRYLILRTYKYVSVLLRSQWIHMQ